MHRIFIIVALVFCCSCLSAQSLLEKVTDLMEFEIGSPAEDQENYFQAKVILAPIAYYEPNTSLGLGIGANLLFKPKGSGQDTRTSNIPIGISYTLKNQVFFSSGYTIFFPEERWLLRGNLEYSDFPQGYYGVGSRQTEANRIEIQYQQLLVEPLLLRQVRPNLFVGGGFRYNNFFNTRLNESHGDLMEGLNLQDSLGSTSVGAEFAVTFDDRDNVVNASKGEFTEFTHGIYGKLLGGTHAFQLSKLDLRRYRQLGPKQLLAMQFYGRYAWGETPVQELSMLGGPTLMRGFQEGRFRDRIALFTQGEYRWQCWDKLGFVFFGGVGQVAPKVNQFALSNMYYSAGAGFRLCVIPSENVNLRVDYAFGFGRQNERGLYLGIGESF